MSHPTDNGNVANNGAEAPQREVRWTRRIIAFLIDLALISFVISLFQNLFSSDRLHVTFVAIDLIVFFLYFYFLEFRDGESSIGKAITKIKVVYGKDSFQYFSKRTLIVWLLVPYGAHLATIFGRSNDTSLALSSSIMFSFLITALVYRYKKIGGEWIHDRVGYTKVQFRESKVANNFSQTDVSTKAVSLIFASSLIISLIVNLLFVRHSLTERERTLIYDTAANINADIRNKTASWAFVSVTKNIASNQAHVTEHHFTVTVVVPYWKNDDELVEVIKTVAVENLNLFTDIIKSGEIVIKSSIGPILHTQKFLVNIN